MFEQDSYVPMAPDIGWEGTDKLGFINIPDLTHMCNSLSRLERQASAELKFSKPGRKSGIDEKLHTVQPETTIPVLGTLDSMKKSKEDL